MASLIYGLQPGGMDEDLFADGAAFAAAAAAGLNSADESLPYSTSELNAPEYSTDDFRMFQFKVARCSKRYVHDWRACPFAHPTENARRRDPRMVKYLPVPCPDYKRGICLRGDSCSYSHGVYECWLHPAKYRTQLCKEGPSCRRPVCFFAHSVLDLRQPSRHMFDNSSAAGGAPEAAVQASVAAVLAQQQAQQQQQQQQAAAARRMSHEASFHRLSSDELLNNMQDGGRGHSMDGSAPSVAAMLANGGSHGSPNGSHHSRHSSISNLTRSSSARNGSGGGSGGSNNGSTGSGSPDRAGSPPVTAGHDGGVAGASSASDAAAAMAVLTQQAQAQAAAALARLSMDAQARLSLDAQARSSMDAAAAARASIDAAAAAATTQAMLQQAGGGLPPRMSLDSLLATRQQQAGWAPGAMPPQGATAAAALAAGGGGALPLNEQPFPQGNAPRMSNAVARKLGLAPQRTSLDARLSKLRGGPGGTATPPRSSIDGILQALQQAGSQRASLDQQAAVLQAMQAQQQLAAAGLGGHPGVAPPMPQAAYGPGAGYGQQGGYGPAGPDAAALHPALLSLVAAQMQGGPGGAPNGMHAGPPPGVPRGMHSGLGAQQGSDANMAALMDSINQWQLNGGAAAMGHRGGSMDGMTGMAGAPQQQGMQAPPPSGPYYDAKGIWGSQEAINNQAGAES